MFGNALGFQNHQTLDRLHEFIQLKILSLPDETLAMLSDGRTVWVCLLEHSLIKICVDLALCFYLFII